ncbi:MAG: DUF4878 domain-containing protein [Flavobacteriaceae bacterium]|jgi:hypothetical protein|nr:DUF4878 domain-containing protein [Flavobacteriaceae bacterium]
MKKIFIGLLLSLVVIGCDTTKKSKELGDENAGKTVIGWYYYYVNEGSYDQIIQYLDEDYIKEMPKEELFNKIKQRAESQGKIKEFLIKDWKLVEKDKKAKVTEYEFRYDVKYEGGKSEVEDFTLIKRGNDLKIREIDFD